MKAEEFAKDRGAKNEAGERGLKNIFKYVPEPPFLFLMACSLFVGGYIPAFYDWSGADQSRPAAVMAYVAIGLIVCCLLTCIALRWLPMPAPQVQPRFQWLRFVPWVVAVGLFAAVAWHLVSPATSMNAIGVVPLSIALVCTGLDWTASRGVRWRIVSLIGCLYLPFFWVTNPQIVKGFGGNLGIVVGMPALLPAAFASRLFNFYAEHHWWTLAAVTSIEILIGLWMIHRGTRSALAWSILMFLQSALSSLALNALIRA